MQHATYNMLQHATCRYSRRQARLIRSAAWLAASAAEQEVSYETHGPCSPSVYERRPAAIDAEAPVAAYTLPPAGDAASTWPNSLPPKPNAVKKIAILLS